MVTLEKLRRKSALCRDIVLHARKGCIYIKDARIILMNNVSGTLNFCRIYAQVYHWARLYNVHGILWSRDSEIEYMRVIYGRKWSARPTREKVCNYT